jgi:hypothetical protein
MEHGLGIFMGRVLEQRPRSFYKRLKIDTELKLANINRKSQLQLLGSENIHKPSKRSLIAQDQTSRLNALDLSVPFLDMDISS